MTLQKSSPCKVNLLLNILGKRADGFHELETLMHPVRWHDLLTFETIDSGVQLHCDDPTLPTDSRNLVHRAATRFIETANLSEGIRIQLEKRIPAAAGLGGGSGNAATTLLGMNELFDAPLTATQLHGLAAELGSDVPFFLQDHPAIGTGRGEAIAPLPRFPALQGAAFLLARPGFGVSTAWAYQALARYPEALHGRPGRAGELANLLSQSQLTPGIGQAFYNSLEAPVLDKYPLLFLMKAFFVEHGAPVALMSGSGSTVFAVFPSESQARTVEDKLKNKFSPIWTCVAPIS